ncbi:general odorant-binding protein 70 [Anabrus simplex]|uniref:general odorant-binding protein 70 n=1 Tax=Anabrus simplex TaxID=316456 RepID=UPI0035A3820A
MVPVTAQLSARPQGSRCQAPKSVAQKLEKDISDCQEEIKFAILQEALEGIGVADPKNRSKRDTVSDDDRKIAGCLLQCVYRKVKAVDGAGYPTRDGLIRLYTEGVTDRFYFSATANAVHDCLVAVYQRRLAATKPGNQTCDIAYDIFECVSDRITQYCEGSS